MKQKGLWKVIALLLGCLVLAGCTTWTIWTDANQIFPVQEEELSDVYVIKENGCPTNGYVFLSEAETKRLVDMLNQCQWEKTRDDMKYEDLVIWDGVDPDGINEKMDERIYEVNICYENKFRTRSFATLLVFADEQVFVKYSNVQFYRDTSGNYDALLELLEEQHLYCQAEYDAACQSEQQNNILQAQLQLIAENQEVWESTKEYPYYYAVTDLNQNGRLELLTSSGMSGTGLYTWSDFYEVDESLQNLEQYSHTFVEGDSQPDIVQDDVQGYYDTQTGELWYVLEDYLKVSAEEYYESKNALCLKNEAVEVQCLARKETVYVDGQPQPTYLDMEGRTITEREYEQMEDTVFADFEKKKAHVSWREVLQLEEFWLLNADAKRAELQTSYEAFSIN